MVNKNKIKGSTFERDVVDFLNKKIRGSLWKRIPGSGAMGTSLGEPLLTGDILGEINGFFRKLRGECKAGYNSSTNKEVKQFTIKKEWFDKIQKEADNSFAFPIFLGKFSGARSGVKVFVAMDIENFCELINRYTELSEELEKRDVRHLGNS